jgi:galactose mutarotase-like enzyme
MPVSLSNGHIGLQVAPEYGGRITQFLDLQSGRDWMVPGNPSAETGEEAVYGVKQAVGWDECFPTVSRWDARGTVWNRNLRDHGDIWGRPMVVTESAPDRLSLIRETAEYRFERHLGLDGPVLQADYQIENRTLHPMPYLWALHALLAVRPGDHLLLSQISLLPASFVAINGQQIVTDAVDWPHGDPRFGFPFNIVPQSNGFMAKLYADVPQQARAFVGGPDRWLGILWDGAQIGHLGLWLTYGGWPSPGPGSVHHLAIEPTTDPADHLGQVVGSGGTPPLPPGGRKTWSVRFIVSDKADPD